MEAKRSGSRYFVKLEKGEEIVGALSKFCMENNIRLGTVSAIGAAQKVALRTFDLETRKYITKEFEGDYEIAPMIGNISVFGSEIVLHLHITIAGKDFSAFAGHLQSAVVGATCEIVIDASDGEVSREFDREIGLNLWKM